MEKRLREKKRLIGEKKESEGIKDNMKMTLIERWNDAIWRRKKEKCLSYLKKI